MMEGASIEVFPIDAITADANCYGAVVVLQHV